MTEMKEPLGFGVREAEPPTDASYKALKKSILDDPTVVCHISLSYLVLKILDPERYCDIHHYHSR